MRKLSKLLCILAVSLLTLGVFAGCGGGDPVSEIYIKKGEFPQTTLVQGNDLNLSSGYLTLVKKETEESIPFTTEGVTITGYEKDTLGTQTLTVTYKNKTTTFDVTVIPRILVQNVETDYFVGDDLNDNEGQLRIAKDDGTTFNVALNADTVTIEGFDSSAAATGLTVTARYQSGATNYAATYQVNIYEPEKVTMSPASKTRYYSHETTPDVNGMYFTVTANNGKMTKYVPVPSDLVKGFNPGLATSDNRIDPLTQELTITYLGTTFTYDITIQYSGVSVIREAAKTLSVIDWTKDTVSFGDQLGLTAIDAMQEYFKLSNSHKELLTQEEIETVVRPAVVYAEKLLTDEAKTFNHTFIMEDDGKFSFVGESYQYAKEDYERLLDSKDSFNVYGTLLHNLSNQFADLVIGGKVTVEMFLANLYTQEELQLVIDILKLFTELHESLMDVPTDWTVEDLKSFSTQIVAVPIRISASQFVGYYYSSFYYVLSTWREKQDFFDIVYSYYLYNDDESRKNAIVTTLWDVVPQPSPLQDIYLAIVNGTTEENYITSNFPLWYDTSLFRMSYKQAIDLANEIKNGDNQFYKDLYNFINYDSLIASYLVNSTSGVAALTGALYDDPTLNEFMGQYLTLVEKYWIEGEAFDFAANGEAIEDLFNSFVDLTPSWQRGFLNAVYTLYDEANMEASVFEFLSSKEVNSYFLFFVAEHYIEVLSEEGVNVFQKLLYAIEDYANRYKYSDGLSSFTKTMGEIETEYNALSVEGKSAFNEHLGYAYEKYLAIAKATGFDLGDWEDEFEQLQTYLKEFNEVSAFLSDKSISNEEKEGIHVLLFSIYEKASILADTIKGCGDAEIVRAFIAKEYEAGLDSATSLDYAIYQARKVFMGYMVNSKITITEGNVTRTYIAWDLYSATDVGQLLVQAYDVLIRNFYGEIPSLEDVAALTAQFRAIDASTQNMFFMLDVEKIYYSAIEAAYKAAFNDSEMEVATALIAVEKAYASCLEGETEETVAAFNSAMNAVTALVSSDDVASSENYQTYLKDMYEYYLAKYNEWNA